MRRPLEQTNMLKEARAAQSGQTLVVEILLAVAVYLISQVAVSVPLSVGEVVWIFQSDILARTAELLADGNILGSMEEILRFVTGEMPAWLLLLQLYCTALSIVVLLLFGRLVQKRRLPSFGLRRGKILPEYLAGAGIGALLFSAAIGLSLLTGSVTVSSASFSFPVLLLFFFGYLLQGASEEILCRGFVMISVSRRHSLLLAVIINSVFFSLLHLANPGFGLIAFLNIILFGVLESVYVLKRGNLWGACAMHSLWNFCQGNLFGASVSGMSLSGGASPLVTLPVDGKELLCGDEFGPESGLCATVVLVLAIVLALFVMKTNQSELAAPEIPADASGTERL